MRIFTIITVVILTACISQKEENLSVMHAGVLMDIMHKQDFSANIKIDTLEHTNLYALGALEGLHGEAMVWNGQPFMTIVKSGEKVEVDNSKQKAALLVYTWVKRWKEVPVSPIESIKDLEQLLSELNIKEPFPFLIKGNVSHLKWHVVDVDPKHPELEHKSSGYQGEISNEPVDALGFYSSQHQGIFTHRDSKLHMHFKTLDGSKAGHIDVIKFNEAKILIPDW